MNAAGHRRAVWQPPLDRRTAPPGTGQDISPSFRVALGVQNIQQQPHEVAVFRIERPCAVESPPGPRQIALVRPGKALPEQRPRPRVAGVQRQRLARFRRASVEMPALTRAASASEVIAESLDLPGSLVGG